MWGSPNPQVHKNFDSLSPHSNTCPPKCGPTLLDRGCHCLLSYLSSTTTATTKNRHYYLVKGFLVCPHTHLPNTSDTAQQQTRNSSLPQVPTNPPAHSDSVRPYDPWPLEILNSYRDSTNRGSAFIGVWHSHHAPLWGAELHQTIKRHPTWDLYLTTHHWEGCKLP